VPKTALCLSQINVMLLQVNSACYIQRDGKWVGLVGYGQKSDTRMGTTVIPR